MKIDIASVVFNDELPLLELQARSLSLLAPDAVIGRILLYINEADPQVARTHIEQVVRPLYGVHADKLSIRWAGDLAPTLPELGWLGQQACKLDAARFAGSEYYLLLDAKHHLIRPLAYDRLVDDEGRGLKPLARARADQRPWLEDSLRYFGLDPEIAHEPSPASAPPFPMHTRTVRDLVDHIESREGRDLLTWFGSKTDRTTEFTLYYAYLVSRGEQALRLRDTPAGYATLRISTDVVRKRRTYAALGEERVWCFGVHRRHFARLPADDQAKIAETWAAAGLFDDLESALAETERLKTHFSTLHHKERERLRLAKAVRSQLKPLGEPA